MDITSEDEMKMNQHLYTETDVYLLRNDLGYTRWMEGRTVG